MEVKMSLNSGSRAAGIPINSFSGAFLLTVSPKSFISRNKYKLFFLLPSHGGKHYVTKF